MDFAHLGKSVSLFPIANEDGSLNQVSGVRLAASEILSVLLIMTGEVYLMPGLGKAPEIFEPLSGYRPELWIYTSRKEIMQWCAGTVEDVQIEVGGMELYGIPDPENRAHAYITFTPKFTPDKHLLTFGWYAYTGAIYDQDFSTFLDGIEIDGERFTGVTG